MSLKSESKPNYTYDLVWMTPDMAKKILEKNNKNRPLNARKVAKYAEAMRTGAWCTQNPISCMSVLDTSRITVDSQHRLNGVIVSGVSMWWNVFSNVLPEARNTTDTGKSRTPADQLFMAFHGPVQGRNGLFLPWVRSLRVCWHHSLSR